MCVKKVRVGTGQWLKWMEGFTSLKSRQRPIRINQTLSDIKRTSSFFPERYSSFRTIQVRKHEWNKNLINLLWSRRRVLEGWLPKPKSKYKPELWSCPPQTSVRPLTYTRKVTKRSVSRSEVQEAFITTITIIGSFFIIAHWYSSKRSFINTIIIFR